MITLIISIYEMGRVKPLSLDWEIQPNVMHDDFLRYWNKSKYLHTPLMTNNSVSSLHKKEQIDISLRAISIFNETYWRYIT